MCIPQARRFHRAINSLSSQILGSFQKFAAQLPQAGVSSTGLDSNDYSAQMPFTDNSDKGDLRLDYQQNQNSSWFLRVSDRKETGVNYPTIPLPLDGQTNGTIRVLDQQVALGYTHLFGGTRWWMRGWDYRRQRRASTRCRLAERLHDSRACRRIRLLPAGCLRSGSAVLPALDGRAPIRNGRIRRCSIPR